MADVDMKESPSIARSDSSEDESDAESVELLVTGRERRKTAGNRYNRDLILQEVGNQEEEDDDDEVALLFAGGLDEEEDDEQPLPKKPSKKKERVTWLPDQDAGGRASLRKQTVAHREHTLARLRESEAQSKKLKALKAIRDRERAKDAPKAMTQADRLAEAERVERRNAKSLNRWEAMEKKRAEEQAAKLAALKERKLEGPVITWWSGKAIWRRPLLLDTAMEGASPVDSSGEPKKRGRKPKHFHEQLAAGRAPSIPTTPAPHAQPSPLQQSNIIEQKPQQEQQPQQSQQPSQPPHTPQAPQILQQPQLQSMPEPPVPPEAGKIAFLPGIHEFANLPDEGPANSSVLGNPAALNTPALPKDTPVADVAPSPVPTPIAAGTLDAQTSTPHTTSDVDENPSKATTIQPLQINNNTVAPAPAPVAVAPVPLPLQPDVASSTNLITTGSEANSGPSSSAPSLSVQTPPPVPIIEEFTTKNLVALDKLDELSDQERVTYNVFFRNKRVPRPPQRRPELCPITTQVARYKDPATGIGYANLMAYRVLQELKEHKFIWSPMLGCYVGRDGAPAARGRLDSTATAEEDDDTDTDTVKMTSSFLQYCAMCEKQITHPSTKILYCSQACRKKDDAKPLSASTLPSSYLYAADTPAWDPRSTSPPLHDAAARRVSPVRSIRITPEDDHVFKPDPDPTEWKPKLGGRAVSLQTDAYRYLSRFQAEHEYVRADRPSLAQRRMHTGMHLRTKSLTTTPSLVSTPTTAASSLSFEVGYDCDFANRPLNLRTNPLYAISPAAKSVDLVTPHIVPSLSGTGGGVLGEMTWEKKPISRLGFKHSSALSKEFS
ncbi:hypothetical protein DV738_g5391, partial [Chaetothyriales sp. CBS 135597]